MKTKIIELLVSTERKGIGELILHMDEIGFFIAPCSGGFHLCKVGGLMEHSLNVYNFMQAVRSDTDILENETNSIIISALLHDLGKAGYHGKQNYVDNILANGKVSTAKPYETNKDRLYISHEIVSLQIATKFIELTEEEEFSILYHNGMYTSSGRDIQGKERPLQILLHFSDLYCSRFIESKGE